MAVTFLQLAIHYHYNLVLWFVGLLKCVHASPSFMDVQKMIINSGKVEQAARLFKKATQSLNVLTYILTRFNKFFDIL